MEKSEQARAALTELYNRHYGYLKRRFEESYGRQVAVADLLQDTFIRASKKAAKYEPANSDSTEEQKRRTQAWLGKIGKNLFLDQLKENERFEPDEHIEATARRMPPGIRDGIEATARGLSPQLRDGREVSESVELVMDVLDELKWKERVVLRVTWCFYDPEKEHNRLPNDVSARLAEWVDVKPGSVRKIRQRAREKLETGVKERRREQ